MSDSAMVILNDEISNKDLYDFISCLSGSLVPEEDDNFVISDGDASVWLGIQPHDLQTQLFDGETLREWEIALGGKPRSIVELQIGHSDKSYQLYLCIACKMGEKWKLVLHDVDEQVLTYGKLLEKYQANRDKLRIDK